MPNSIYTKGIKIAKNIMIGLLIAGALSGLAGVCEVTGISRRLQQGLSIGYGYTAIIVAWLAQLNPIAAIFVAVLIAALLVGGDQVQMMMGLPAAMGLFLQGMLLFPMLVGIGGAHLSLSYAPGWTENITGGRGWIVIALVIFSMWNPARAVWGAILFGGINAVQFRLQASGTTIPASFLNMLPYLATVLVLVMLTWWETLSKRIGAPSALAKSYMQEEK